MLAALVLAAAAFGPGAGSSGLGAGDLLIAAVTLASGLALWGLGTLLRAERI